MKKGDADTDVFTVSNRRKPENCRQFLVSDAIHFIYKSV